MTEELKSQITALRTAIMRRVEFDQCIHASSLEDEIGKWVREVFAEPDYHKMAWSGYAEKMVEKVAEKSAIDDILKARITHDGYFKVGDVSCGLVLTEKDGLYEWKAVDYQAEGKKWLAQVDADLRATGHAFLRTDNHGRTTAVPALDVLKPAPDTRANPTWLLTTYPTTVTRTDAVAPGPQKMESDGYGEFIPIDQATFRSLADKGWFEPATREFDKVGLRWTGLDGLIYKVIG